MAKIMDPILPYTLYFGIFGPLFWTLVEVQVCLYVRYLDPSDSCWLMIAIIAAKFQLRKHG